MADTTFVDQTTVIEADWLNDVNDLVYGIDLYLDAYNILRDIPAAEHAAIIAGTSTYDVSTIVRTRLTALGPGGRLYFEGKKYYFATADGGATISSYIRVSNPGVTICGDRNCQLVFLDAAVVGIYVETTAQLFSIDGPLLYGTETAAPTIELLRVSAPYPDIGPCGFAYGSLALNLLGVIGTGVYVATVHDNQFSNCDRYVKYSGSATADVQFYGNTYGDTTIGTTNPCVEIAGLGMTMDDYAETNNHTKTMLQITTGAQRAVIRGNWLACGDLIVQQVDARIDLSMIDCWHVANARSIRIDGGGTADLTGTRMDGNGSAGGITGVSCSGTLIYGAGKVQQFQTGIGFSGLATLGNVLLGNNGTAVSAGAGASGEGVGLAFSGNTTDATLNAASTFALVRRASTASSPAGAGTVTPDVAAGDLKVITMPAGNITIAAPTNPFLGAILRFVIIQDAVGGRTITWNATYKKAADGAGGANGKGATSFTYDGTNWVQQGGALAFA